jgi:hypothetical protein
MSGRDIGSIAFTTEMLKAIETRIAKRLGSYAEVMHYIGQVTAVDYSTNTASVKILGNSTASTGFTLSVGVTPVVNDMVVVCMFRHQRWVDRVVSPTGYARFTQDSNGSLSFGPGGTAYDTNLYRSASGTLKTDGSLIVVGQMDATVRGGKFSGTSAVTLSTSMQKLDLANTLDGESAFLVAASDRVQVPTGAGGLYRVQASVKTPTGLAGTTNLRVAIYVDGAEVGFHPFNPTVAATTGGAVAHWVGVVAASSYIEVFAAAGSGVSAGTAQVIELAVIRIASEWAA